MADINLSIDYSKESISTIKNKTIPPFNHNNWGDDDLLGVRKEIRAFYRKQQKGICYYCKQTVSITYSSNCHIEHIVPKGKHLDFIFTPKNLCVSCAECNLIKGEQEVLKKPSTVIRYPRSSGAFKLVHPHFDEYDKHIRIINGYYIDKGSKKGNFTIGLCNLNRKLGELGWEPEITNEADLIQDMNGFIDEKDSIKRAKKLHKLKDKLFET